MLLGAHNSIAGGFHNAAAQAHAIGGEVMQIFCKNQRQFRARPITSEEVHAFRSAVEAARLGPVMVHDSYIINMGTPDDAKRSNACEAFCAELQRCEQLGVQYLNFHPGSHTNPSSSLRDDAKERRACLDRIARCLDQACDEVPGKVKLVIENAAGQGTNVGHTWQEVGYLADAVGDQHRIGVCVDTQHAWAAGYDWVDAYDEVWDRFDDEVGLGRLVAFHLNDSKQPCGARVDRHDNIPTGHLGAGFWSALMRDPRFADVPGYLETPLVGDDVATWRQEIAFLKGLRQGSPGQPADASRTKATPRAAP